MVAFSTDDKSKSKSVQIIIFLLVGTKILQTGFDREIGRVMSHLSIYQRYLILLTDHWYIVGMDRAHQN